MHRLKLAEVFYFEVVDDRSFLYTQAAVFEAKEKLYEFERLCAGSTLFRCSKSMILNAEKIDYVRPSLSGRFEAVLSNGEKAVVSRKYVADLKRMLGGVNAYEKHHALGAAVCDCLRDHHAVHLFHVPAV